MSDDYDSTDDLKPLAIEGQLPLKAVGIENLREANPKHLPPHRYLHPWFARRPTPASRLAILASVLPKDTDPDDLLQWLQIGPKQGVKNETISKYVERMKATEDDRSGNLENHYGYPRPFTSSPTEAELEGLHETLREHWDGELPEVIDPTAGGGVIPFESLRYGLPTKANELNPVPSVMLKVMLEYAPKVGSLGAELKKWAKKINKRATENLEEYFPSAEPDHTPDSYVSTYKLACPTCGSEIPLVPKWWVRTRKSADTVVAKPRWDEDGKVEYDCLIEPTEQDLVDFNPDNGPVSRGGSAECMNCGVVLESDQVKARLKQGNFEYDVYCVRTKHKNGGYSFRAPNRNDTKALQKARRKINNDFELSQILSIERHIGPADRAGPYGITEWRDAFSPRQLLSHYYILEAFRNIKDEIASKHDDKTTNALFSLLALSCSKLVDRNSRLADWDTTKGYPNPTFKGNNFAFKRVFTDNNLTTGGNDLLSQVEKVSSSYDELASYIPNEASQAEVTIGDAAQLPYQEGVLQSVVIDPPYYSSVMYSELSDAFYVWLKEYLDDVYPDAFSEELTNKGGEAVADSSKFEAVAGEKSKSALANKYYERKMGEIFSELYRVLEPGGVMTVMFTHKETDAWDTLTMSLIDSGFTITSTHPITSEMPQRANMRENASADSTLLLTGRKPHEERAPENTLPSLWSDVKADTRETAKEAARDLLDSGVSLTKTDVIISAFGPTLRVFADAYPVVDDEDEEVAPRKALEEAREAVTQVLVEEFLDGEGVDDLDDITKWYVLCWLVHESETFAYDDGNQLGHGIGVDIDAIKRSTKVWRKNRGDIKLRQHDERVQNVNQKPEDRSSRLPVDPDALSYSRALDRVHAAMHVYDATGESAACDWLRERNFDTDSEFKATLKALLQVLPHDHGDWELARDLAVGRTRDVLDLDFSPNVFADDGDGHTQKHVSDYE